MESVAKLRYRALPLIASPLEQEGHGHDQHHGTPNQTSEAYSTDKSEHVVSTYEHHNGTPAFREKEEASSIELFFDLFFVANLTSFTNVHAIDDKKTIQSYIGFFAILWFTWLQVVLYDVRFGVDSLFERVAKLIHFGVMVTFAIIGSSFDPTSPEDSYVTMRQVSLTLMISRVVLIVQYGVVMLWVKNHRRLVIPLLIHIATFAVGAILCFKLLFSFTARSAGKAYFVWYVIIVMEALAVFLSSSQWRSLSFAHTNLNERCGLLTLIILGEGIIVLTKSVGLVVKGENFSSGIIAQIISAILIIYFVYMLYFDQSSHTPPSPILHHLWALLHFPFHAALVLLMEGTSRFITWRNAMEMVDYVYAGFESLAVSANSTEELTAGLEEYSSSVLKLVEADLSKYDVTSYLTSLAESDFLSDDALDSEFGILITLVNATLKFFKIQAAKATTKAKSVGLAEKDPFQDLINALDVYDLVFVYFFIAAGLTLIIMAIVIALNKKGKLGKGDWAAIGLRTVMGVALALIATVTVNYDAQQNFLSSVWMLPTVMMALLIVVVVDGVLGWVLPATETHKHTGEA